MDDIFVQRLDDHMTYAFGAYKKKFILLDVH